MKKIEVKIKKLPGNDDIPLPIPMSAGASGMDLYAAVKNEEILQPREIKLISTGIQVAIPSGFEGQVRPRSGLALKHGISIVNSPGTIDSDYRGTVGIILINQGKELFSVKRGERLAQLIICPVAQVELRLVEDLGATKRESGGFGHTGK